jgi:hypothetical protein
MDRNSEISATIGRRDRRSGRDEWSAARFC